MPFLRIKAPEQKEVDFELPGKSIVVGNATDCELTINDPGMSKRHCQIEPDTDGKFKIVDLETKAGTEVNGVKVNVHALEHGDRIYLGDTSILFEDVEAIEADEPETKTDRIRVLRRRRGRPARRRRVVLPPAKDKVFSVEDLKVVLESLVEEQGVEALEAARKELDKLFEDHKGAPLYESLSEDRDNLFRMLEINKLINSEHNLKRLLEIIMDSMVEMTGAERGFLILKEKNTFVIKVARNFDREAIRKPEFKVSHTIAEETMRTGKSIVSADALNDPALPAAGSVTGLKLRSLLCLPFTIRDKVIGCIYIDNRFDTGVFIDSDLPLLQGLADQAAIAIENTRLYEDNEKKQELLRKAKDEVDRLNVQLRNKVEKQYVELAKVKQDLLSSTTHINLKYDYRNIIGKSRAMEEVLFLLDKVIESDEPIFIHGESGTGRELVARAIHFNSKRNKGGKFISENCSAIPETLLESEMFGYEKGAFTGANQQKRGLFELAHNGTLFLDEIGDMPMEMQKLLLRAIQEGEIRRVGGKDIIKVDVRLLSASNKDLSELIKTGAFREDLFYRLNVVKITLPPLRDRKEDIPLLVEHFLGKIAKESGNERKSVDEAAYWYLQNYRWPGNVRELENEIRRAVALSEDLIMVDHLKEEIRSKELFKANVTFPSGTPLKEIVKEAVEDVERKVILRALEECKWKKTEAARILQISRPTLDAKIESYGLKEGQNS